ncbi:MAG: hypothetical protein IIZ94_00205 [Prevotella sp.]|nr:hypothetical protein [Prevotella sp.]
MISMYAEYSGRTLYVALSSDTIEGAKNGDTLYEMDTGKRYVYNETNDAWDEQPEEGGGGTLIEKIITTNGTFAATDDDADGYSSVTTNVLPAEFTLNVKNNLTGSSGAQRNATVFTSRKPTSTPATLLYEGTTAVGNGKTTQLKIPGNPQRNSAVIVIRTNQAATITLPSNMYLMLGGNDINYPNLYEYVMSTKLADATTSYEITINPAS